MIDVSPYGELFGCLVLKFDFDFCEWWFNFCDAEIDVG